MAGAANLYDADAYPLWQANHEKYVGGVTFTVGGSGAISATSADDARFAGDTFASGVCALTYPACQRGRLQCSLVSDGTVQEVVITALSTTAGTATVKTTKAGVATEPESGAKIMIRVFGEVST